MASITNERLNELVQLYDRLKARVLQIDVKYSLEFVEPELDMPESLNLTKLTYKPKTNSELTSLANQQVAAVIIAKQSTLDKNYNSKIKSLSLKIANVQLSASQKIADAQEAAEKDLKDIRNRLVNNGLIFSTISTKYENQVHLDYKTATNKIKTSADDAIALINQEQKDAEAVYAESCNNLTQERTARAKQCYQKLVEEEEKLKRSIEKYNTGLDEKEQKYQASRAKAYESARRAAYERAYNNSKLYMEMGETGYRRSIEKEKYAVCQDAFYPLRRTEAQAILSMDSFIMTNLGTYYSTFVDWINMTLLP